MGRYLTQFKSFLNSRGLRYDLILILIILSLSSFFWRYIPTLKFSGEGLFYFFEKNREPIFSFPLPVDTMGRLLFTFEERVFQGNVPLYFWFLMLGMLLTDLTIYIFIKKATGSRTAAFFASFIFSLSFVGKFDVYSLGVYFRFVQREILAIPAIFAFLFLILYLRYNFKFKFYILSLPVSNNRGSGILLNFLYITIPCLPIFLLDI